MIDIFRSIIQQLFIALYQFTSFQIGGYDVGGGIRSTGESFLNTPAAHVLEFILAIASIALFIGFLIVSSKLHQLRLKISASQQMLTTEAAGETLFQNKWKEILGHIDSIHEGEWKFAIIEADTMVDDILKDHFSGDTMGDRLANIDKTKLLTIDSLWEAHKVRNRLAHDANYFLRHAEAVRAIRLYEETLKELGAL